jgi:sialate O-acetylesterase
MNQPVGLIQSAWGGTPAESWISLPALAADPALISVYADWAAAIEAYPLAKARYDQALAKWEQTKQGARPQPPQGPGHQWEPASLYNAMIHPLVNYAVRGMLWYQGESNSGKRRGYVYRRLFPAMIQDWRARWGQGDFPFLWVQLANFENNGEWAEIREAQTMTLHLANTGQAVTTDIGEAKDIHPKNKQDVGLRLALAARAIAYGEKLVYSGPLYRQAVNEGGAIRVYFDHVGGGLAARGGGVLTGFLVAGADKKFVPAEAKVVGTTVVVTSNDVARPMYVRYAWGGNPDCNLVNAEGLPASPFRSDTWTEPAMYR